MTRDVATHGVQDIRDTRVVVNCPGCRRVMWANGVCRHCVAAEMVTLTPVPGGVHHGPTVGREG